MRFEPRPLAQQPLVLTTMPRHIHHMSIYYILFCFQELADLKDRIAKETAEADAKKNSEGPPKIDEKNANEAKSALEAAMAATLAEYAPPSAPSPMPGKKSLNHKKHYQASRCGLVVKAEDSLLQPMGRGFKPHTVVTIIGTTCTMHRTK